MTADGASVLPYRTDALALGEWLGARARGRTAVQLRGSVDSPKAVEGTAAAASALGFTASGEGGLTPLGERYVLAEVTERRRMMHDAMLAYAPYGEMLRALVDRGAPAETEVRWLEAWWATHGYGSSESNRREGAAAFGRLGDFAGLGAYVPGRRGRPTRIRWAPDTLARPRSGEETERGRPSGVPAERDPDLFSAPAPALLAHAEPATPRDSLAGEGRKISPPGDTALPVNRITVPLAGMATARIEVPLRLPRAEKRRLLDLLELLITED